MSEKLLSGMNYGEFDTLVNAYIDRSSHQYDEMPTSLELLFHDTAQRSSDTVESKGRIVERLLAKQTAKPNKKMKLNWAGSLDDYRDQYTSLELQEKALDWRIGK